MVDRVLAPYAGHRSVRARTFSTPMVASSSVVWVPRGSALAEALTEGTGAATSPRPATAKAAALAGTTRSRRLAQGARMPW